MWLQLLFLAAAVCAALLGSLCYSIWQVTPTALRGPHRQPMKVGVVLGSGGHTSEMLRTINEMPHAYWKNNRPFYVVSATDTHSSSLAEQQEQRVFQRRAIVYVIPRAREVGQSYLTSTWSTVKAAFASLRIILVEKPDVLLTNGPGVCVPVIAAAMCVSACLPWWYRRPAVVYMESFTCVHHLSLTGRLLAPFMADVFTVHWRSLEAVVRPQLRHRRGRLLVYLGCEGEAEKTDVAEEGLPRLPESQEAYALVTVGSTKFAALVEAMVQPHVCAALQHSFGITKLYVQYGTAALRRPAGVVDLSASVPGDASTCAVQRWRCDRVEVEAFPYRPHLAELIKTATLVVTHAGAGTILEVLQARRPMVVVPNRQLMSDHQLELAEGLAAGHHLFSLQVSELAERLPRLDLAKLRPHKGMNAEQLKRSLQGVLAGQSEGPSPREKSL